MRLKIIAAAVLALVVGVAFLMATRGPARAPACRAETFDQSRFTVCIYEPGRDDFRLLAADGDGVAYRTFEAVAAALGGRARVRFAMNAGMFDDDGAPIGLYVEAGRTLKPANTRPGPGNFHMLPNGVLSVDTDGVARVETTAAFLARDARPAWATQSGPMLVIDGALHPAIREDGPSRLVRNGVGVLADGRAAFVISDGPVSFGRFARYFRDGLGCRDALFLDGTVSALWAPAMGRRDSGAALGPIAVVVEKREARQ